MLIFVAVLAGATIIIETALSWRFRWWRRLAQRSIFINALMSLALGVLLSGVFGANGIILLCSALVATVGSVIVNRIIGGIQDHLIPAAQKLRRRS